MDIQSENIGRRIVSGGSWRVVGLGVSTLFGVFALAVISREVGPAEFSQFATLMSLIAIAMLFSDFGLLALGLRDFAALEGVARDRSQQALVTLRMLFSAASAIAVVAFAGFSGYSSGLIAGLAAAGFGLIAWSLHISWTVPIQATFRLNTIAALEVFRQSLLFVLMVVSVLVTGEVGWVVAMYLPVGVLLALITGRLARGLGPLSPRSDTAEMRRLLRSLGAFAIAAGVGAAYAFVVQIVSDAILPPEESGFFGLGFRVYAVLVGGCSAAIIGAFPLLVQTAKDDRKRMVYAARRLLQTVFLVGCACTVGLVTGASFVTLVLGGSEFADAADAIAVIGVALPASFLLVTGGSILLADARHRELVLISVTGAAVSIGVTAFLAHEFGLMGAAWGLVFGEVAIATGYMLTVRAIDRRVVPSFGWALAVLAISGVSCLPALLDWPGLARAVLGLAAFAVLAVVVRLVPPELLDRVRPNRAGDPV